MRNPKVSGSRSYSRMATASISISKSLVARRDPILESFRVTEVTELIGRLVGPGRRFWNFLDWPTSVREHHLRFHARIVVVFSIHITKNLEGQITRAMGGGHA